MSQFKDRSRKIARELYWEENDRETYQCPDCDRTEDEILGKFEVHHKNGEAMDNRPENHVGLCRLCHNLREDKKPSKKRIRHLRSQAGEETVEDGPDQVSVSEVESVYLAGTMTYHGEDSYWSASVKEGNSTVATWRKALGEFGPLAVNSPQDLHFNHGGDLVAGVAGSDIELLDESDAILAYFDKEEQVGTLTELMYAVQKNKPGLVLFNSKFVGPPAIDPFDEVEESHQWLTNTIGMRFESPVYWFLVNFLLGDSNGLANGVQWNGVETDVRVGVVSDLTGISDAYREWSEPAMNQVFSPDICEICGSRRDEKAWIGKGTDREKKVCAGCARNSFFEEQGASQ